MPVEEQDLVKGSGLTDDKDGFVFTRMYAVTGQTGDRDAKLYLALREDGIPQRGDPHPTIPGLFADHRTAEPRGASTVWVTIIYRALQAPNLPPDDKAEPEITVGSTVQTIITRKDNAGKDLKVNYDGLYRKDQQKKKIASVDLQFPVTIVSLKRREKEQPKFKSLRHVGTVNRTSIFGAPARTWLCAGITGISDDGGDSYEVLYEFHYNAITWDVLISWFDDDTGLPPNDATLGEPKPNDTPPKAGGQRKVRIYNETEFRDLDL